MTIVCDRQTDLQTDRLVWLTCLKEENSYKCDFVGWKILLAVPLGYKVDDHEMTIVKHL